MIVNVENPVFLKRGEINEQYRDCWVLIQSDNPETTEDGRVIAYSNGLDEDKDYDELLNLFALELNGKGRLLFAGIEGGENLHVVLD
jgi:hypothetical protein